MFLLQTPMSPNLEQQNISTPVPQQLPRCPSAMQIHPEQAFPEQGTDLSCYPIIAFKSCSSSHERGRKTGISAAPLAQSQREGCLVPVPLSPSLGSRARSRAVPAATQMPGSICDHCRQALPLLNMREGTSSPNSSRFSFPLCRTTSSPFSTKARLALNKAEEAPSHSDPVSFYSRTLSKWAEGQG